ncbi:ABC transporter ATP-binding protein [Chitinibacteraceae bacterium HSL-7]
MSVLSVRDLTCAYGDRLILKDITFDVEAGEIVTILGGSGCGKSTLLKHLIGLYPPAHGQVLIHDQDLTAAQDAERTAILTSFGVAFQSGALFGAENVLDNVCLPLREYTDLPEAAIETVARLKLREVGLEEYAHFMPAELSGGMQKRAALARALALSPSLVFLDEPSAGLDPITSAELDALLIRLARALGLTFIVVTHELASIFAIADRAVMLDRDAQSIIAIDTPAALRDHPDARVHRFFRRNEEITR